MRTPISKKDSHLASAVLLSAFKMERWIFQGRNLNWAPSIVQFQNIFFFGFWLKLGKSGTQFVATIRGSRDTRADECPRNPPKYLQLHVPGLFWVIRLQCVWYFLMPTRWVTCHFSGIILEYLQNVQFKELRD